MKRITLRFSGFGFWFFLVLELLLAFVTGVFIQAMLFRQLSAQGLTINILALLLLGWGNMMFISLLIANKLTCTKTSLTSRRLITTGLLPRIKSSTLPLRDIEAVYVDNVLTLQKNPEISDKKEINETITLVRHIPRRGDRAIAELSLHVPFVYCKPKHAGESSILFSSKPYSRKGLRELFGLLENAGIPVHTNPQIKI